MAAGGKEGKPIPAASARLVTQAVLQGQQACAVPFLPAVSVLHSPAPKSCALPRGMEGEGLETLVSRAGEVVPERPGQAPLSSGCGQWPLGAKEG